MHSLRCIGNWHLWIKHVRESAATNPKHSLESLVFPRERICALPYITARIAASLTHHATRGRVSSCATDERQPFAREPQMADNGTFQSTQDLLFPDWQPQYRAALLETNPQQLHKSVLNC